MFIDYLRKHARTNTYTHRHIPAHTATPTRVHVSKDTFTILSHFLFSPSSSFFSLFFSPSLFFCFSCILLYGSIAQNNCINQQFLIDENYAITSTSGSFNNENYTISGRENLKFLQRKISKTVTFVFLQFKRNRKSA